VTVYVVVTEEQWQEVMSPWQALTGRPEIEM